MVIREQALTAEDFWATYAGNPYELINGKAVEMAPAGGMHGSITRRIGALLGDFVDDHELGEVFGAETGFRLGDDLRGADAAFVTQARWETVTEPDKFVPFAPDLAVEVVSPNDTAADIHRKVVLYLTNGTRLVWVVYPELRQVVVHYPDQTAQTINEDQSLGGGEVLPGLKITVSKIFPPKRS